MRQARVLVAEFLGTFALVFFGAGSICADALLRGKAAFGPGDLVLVAAAHAVVLAVMVSALAHISGSHFNPAVTIALAVGKRIEAGLAIAYVVTQLVAGIVAAALLAYVFPSTATTSARFGAPVPSPDTGALKAMVIEAVLTFFLVTVIYATAVDPRGAFDRIAGFCIGLTLFFVILVGGPFTGAALNPARAFGPALFAGSLDGVHFLAYWVGPVIGGLVAGFLYERVLIKEPVAAVPHAPWEEDVTA